jgi:hypothetical protein
MLEGDIREKTAKMQTLRQREELLKDIRDARRNPESTELRFRLKTRIRDLLERIDFVFVYDPDVGDTVITSIMFVNRITRNIIFFPDYSKATIWRSKAKWDTVMFPDDHPPGARSKSGKKMNNHIAREMFRLRYPKDPTQTRPMYAKKIARLLGFGFSTTYHILEGRSWSHIHAEFFPVTGDQSLANLYRVRPKGAAPNVKALSPVPTVNGKAVSQWLDVAPSEPELLTFAE